MNRDLITVIVLWSVNAVLVLLNIIFRKKIKLLPSVLITICIVFFSLYVPSGKVLFYFRGSLPVTLGAIYLGLRKSAIVCGSFFLSRLIVSKNLKLPGKPGIFVKQIFFWYEKFISTKIIFTDRNVIQKIDEYILKIWNSPENKK